MPPRGRSHLLVGPAILAAGFALSSPCVAFTLDGYAWPASVRQGEPLGLYVSSSTGSYHLTIIRTGAPPETVFSAPSLPASLQPVPGNASAWGCGWTRSLYLVVPNSWRSGAYLARLQTGGSVRYAPFVVRENDPGSTGDILLVLATATWEAYNPWGGQSLYDYNSAGGQRSHQVSFQRPFQTYSGKGLFSIWEEPFIAWIEGAGYSVEYASSLDLHADPALESHYGLLLIAGHDEYWSMEMRQQVAGRTQAGRHTAIFGGNTCWWQVRFEGAPDRMICYKEASLDPYLGVDNSRVTVNWRSAPVNLPENPVTGVSYAHGGYVNSNGWYPASQGYGDYQVQRSDHWVYEGTGLGDGEEFGYQAAIVGYEVDGALFAMVNGTAQPTGVGGTPGNFQILALSPASRGYATLGLFSAPGTVFNAATTDWVRGLPSDPAVVRITRNVIDRLRAMAPGQVGVEEGTSARFASLHATPNPFTSLTRITFDLPAQGPVRLVLYDVGGRRVRTLVDAPLGAGPQVVPWPGTDDLGRVVRPGVYLYRLEAGPLLRTGKAIKTR